MNSSSRLFPVSLMNADFAGELHEDVYQLNPGVSPDRTLRINITRVIDPSTPGYRQPVILLHSEFNNRRQWLTPEGEGFAAVLARAGFDVWLPEARGHGLSPDHDRWSANTLSVSASEDLPAIQAFVAEQSGTEPIWVGAELGGLALAYALTHDPRMAETAAGAAFIDVATAHWLSNLGRLGLKQRWLMKRAGFADGMAFNWGPEREPWSLFTELYQWRRLAKKSQHPVYDRLETLRLPVFLLAVKDSERDTHILQSRFKTDSIASAVAAPGAAEAALGGKTGSVRQWLQEKAGTTTSKTSDSHVSLTSS
ncbi:alpha/beta fold hydrolase [Hydrocarboniclastica marina]|uniref:Alpha/beta fold hydrolase n=1 Tax=Hydrocarboniclastica marina TaxID=2259620 RepID=A0A4P7XFA0_9ALTE|nr:alpha/beta fold hydrolase [Hydrocarboniclastica marina]QCF25586.1 alpha/beta fold hydrolase [Hydrocarboniclastica marina]